MVPSLSSLPAERWAEFSRLLDALLEQAPEARAAWLVALEPAHADLAALLRQAAEIDGAPQPALPVMQPPLTPIEDDPWTFAAGRPVGPYRLIAPLGQGGMGEVWSAQRIDGTLNREVALKLPHTWLLNAGARLRLGRERDFLAGLSHPNVAQLFDAGIADDGQPWMALEKVDGQRIDSWCRTRRLPIADRLRLFLQVMDAVSAAHARLIVHRDIKPSNVLVTDEGRVKLLDFGIAKLIDDDGRGDLTEITRLAGRSATPEYAAPEQLSGATITAATDVYALGVLLYELLCGRRPRPARRDRGRDADDESPLLASSFAPPDFPAQAGGLDVAGWRRALEGDLDAILAQALSAKPEARYVSVERMAEDLRRHLASEPISARHITGVERLRKFARRNRLALGSAIVVSVSLLAGGGISLWQAQRATAEARRASAEAIRANATRDFLLKVFNSSSRIQAADRAPGSITAREMLDEIVDGLDDSLARQPEVQLELLAAAQALYRQWYLPERASLAHARYRAIVKRLAGPTDPRIIASRIEEAATLNESDRRDAALSLLTETRPLLVRGGHLGTPLEAEWTVEWTRINRPLTSVTREVIAGFERAARLYRDHADDSGPARWTEFYWAKALLADGRPDEAKPVLEALRLRQQKDSADNDWQVSLTIAAIGEALLALGDRVAASASVEQGHRLILATFGRDVMAYSSSFAMRIDLELLAGNTDAALAMIDDELAVYADLRRKLGTAGADGIDVISIDADTSMLVALKARALLQRGGCGDTEATLRSRLPTMVDYPDMPITIADAHVIAGQCAKLRGDRKTALQEFTAARDRYRALPGFYIPAMNGRAQWAEVLIDSGDSEALGIARTELQMLRTLIADRELPVRVRIDQALAEIALRQGDTTTAAVGNRDVAAGLARFEQRITPTERAALHQRHAALAEAIRLATARPPSPAR